MNVKILKFSSVRETKRRHDSAPISGFRRRALNSGQGVVDSDLKTITVSNAAGDGQKTYLVLFRSDNPVSIDSMKKDGGRVHPCIRSETNHPEASIY
eukprot:5835032-Amphidinium_carterae.2